MKCNFIIRKIHFNSYYFTSMTHYSLDTPQNAILVSHNISLQHTKTIHNHNLNDG